MPITDDLQVQYYIPEKIKSKIPDYFYYAMIGELVSIFGVSCVQKDEDGFYPVDYDGGTSGWYQAMRIACWKTDVPWLLEYWNGLEWYDSDLFDEEIGKEIIKLIEKQDESGANPYYLYWVNKEQKDRNYGE